MTICTKRLKVGDTTIVIMEMYTEYAISEFVVMGFSSTSL